MALKKHHGPKYVEEKLKGYDNITLGDTKREVEFLKGYMRAKETEGVWDKI